MQNNPLPGNDPGLLRNSQNIAALLDAMDDLKWGLDLVRALQCSNDPGTVAVAHHAIERLDNAHEILLRLKSEVKA